MSDETLTGAAPGMDPETEELAQQVADQVESFLIAVREISQYEVSSGQAISLLLLVVSQVLAAGGQLRVQADFHPPGEEEPDPGPHPDMDDMRLRLRPLPPGVGPPTHVFRPPADPPHLG